MLPLLLLACPPEQPVACPEAPCRGDEQCVEGVCEHWAAQELWADLELTPLAERPEVFSYRVLGGFPWQRVKHVRVDFGAGDVGWGEEAFHSFPGPGVYPVRLEVELQGYRQLRASRLAVVEPVPADWNPLRLTVNEIPSWLNGSQPFGSDNNSPADPSDDYQESFHLLLPASGFDINVCLLSAPSDPVDEASLSLLADTALGQGALPAGTDLAAQLSFDQDLHAGLRCATWTVDATHSFPTGLTTLSLSARTESNVNFEQILTIESQPLVPEKDPFDRPMVWLLRFELDLFTASASHHEGGVIAIESVEGSNGQPDFEEELALVGAQGPDPVANATYLRWIKQALIVELRRFFHMAPDGTPRAGIAMDFVCDDEPGAPDPADFRTDGDFSMMRFGGDLQDAFGRSWYSAYNEERVDDTAARMGVGSARLIGLVSAAPVLTDQLNPIKPNTGTPVGDHPLDLEVLDPGFDREALGNSPEACARYDELAWAAEVIGLTVAAVAAHEMGHALGLVPDGPPPDGFFGGRADVSFMGGELTNSHHADYPYLNLMQAGGNPFTILGEALGNIDMPRYYDTLEIFYALGHENQLSHYAMAYLQGKLTYRSF